MSAAPASAQHRRGGDGGGERRESAAPRNDQPRAERREAQPQQQAQPQPQQREQRAVPRSEYRRDERRNNNGGNREYRAVPREEYRRSPQYSAPRYENRRYDNRRYEGRYYNGGRYYGPRYSGPRFTVVPRRFYRPYYVFRPRFSIGFGLSIGYPVTYYDPYYNPYNYYPGGYYPNVGSTVYVGPNANASNMGGVSFDITPDDAEIWVDGNYMGQVADYTPSSQPLGLPAGRHRIELREPGYQVASYDIDVIPGQVIPFQGTLEN